MNRKDHIDKIAKYLARFVEEVKSYNEMNLYDINIHSENALIPILNAVFDIKLQNANALHKKNYPSVDLIDDKNKVAFQVTSTAGLEKIKTTLRKFGENNLQSKYETLYVYILTQKDDKYSEKIIKENTPEGLDFNVDTHIIDISDLRNRITYIQSLEKLEHIARLCEHEFSDVQIESRNKKFQSGFLKNEPENLHLNFLPISFPDKMYVAELNLDEEIIKENINQWRIGKGLRRKNSFRTDELLRNAMITNEVYLQDFILRENQLLTLRDLFDPKDPLMQFVDKGTITEINPLEYYTSSEVHQRNFKNLLRQHLIEKCKTRNMEWIGKKGLMRFRNSKANPSEKKVRWKGKNESTKTAIFKMINKKEGHVICFRSMAFRPSFELMGNEWFLVINPTWSFSNPGGFQPTRFEEGYLSGLKRQENNNTVYYQFRFFGYYLAYQDLFTDKYPFIKINRLLPLSFIPKMDDSKWLPPKEFVATNELEFNLKADNELSKSLFD
jgi:hypothetical protein